MKHYELLFILKPTLTEDEAKLKEDFVKEVISKNGGEIAGVTDMGTRKLAYKINKYERGNYKVFYFRAPTNLISELVRNIRITEEIIRFLVVKYETKLEISAWDKLSKGIKLAPQKREKKIEKSEKAIQQTQEVEAQDQE